MRAIGNFIWFLLGGVYMGIVWWIFGLIAFISIIGIPWGKSCFVIGKFTFFPFGKEAIDRAELSHKEDVGTEALWIIGNVVWLMLAGFWLAIAHVILALAYFITIIGIPFGIQHLKLASISLFPIGKIIVPIDVAAAAREQNAKEAAAKLRGET